MGFCYINLKNVTEKSYTPQKNNTVDKEQTSYDDLLDALRLSLKGYNIK
jgi:hypothetical protein